MHGGAAEDLAGDGLARHRLDRGRAGDVGDGVVGDDDDVGQAEQQGRPADAGARTTRLIGTTPLAWVRARATVPQAWRLATPWRDVGPAGVEDADDRDAGVDRPPDERGDRLALDGADGAVGHAAGQPEPADGVVVESRRCRPRPPPRPSATGSSASPARPPGRRAPQIDSLVPGARARGAGAPAGGPRRAALEPP